MWTGGVAVSLLYHAFRAFSEAPETSPGAALWLPTAPLVHVFRFISLSFVHLTLPLKCLLLWNSLNTFVENNIYLKDKIEGKICMCKKFLQLYIYHIYINVIYRCKTHVSVTLSHSLCLTKYQGLLVPILGPSYSRPLQV